MATVQTNQAALRLCADDSFLAYFLPLAPDFFKQYGFFNPREQTNLTIRLEAAVKTNEVRGDVVQCGVYRGATLGPLAFLVEKLGSGKRVWGADSFKGFPSSSPQDLISGQLPEKAQRDYFANTDPGEVDQRLVAINVTNVTLVPGYFEQSLPQLPVLEISLLILDCDLYDSYLMVLRELYPRVTSGGIIIFDEYYSPRYPGARQAVDEFFADKPEKPQLAREYLEFHPYERWYLVKL